jgi:hypothetical protein
VIIQLAPRRKIDVKETKGIAMRIAQLITGPVRYS